MSSRLPPQTKQLNSFHVALTRVAAIGLLLSLSLVVWAYQRDLEPLYASAPVTKHLSKIVWSCAILGSFVPTVPVGPATIIFGVLLGTLSNSSYWVAVYTARLGDPQWGAVATHLIVLLPILSLGVGLVKALQEAPYSKGDEQTTMSSINLPVCATALNSLQGLWPAVPFISDLPSHQIFSQLGIACITLWTIAPFLPNISPPPSVVVTPISTSATPEPKGKRKKGTPEKPVPSTPPPYKSQNFGGLGKWRLAILPVLPVLSWVFRSSTLPQPLLEPYYHPSYPLRILSSVRSAYSGVVVVGESLAANPDELGGIDYMRYLRAGHSLLGGVWIGPKIELLDPDLQLFDEAGEKLGDTVYSAFLLQEAALLVKKPESERPKNALMIGLGTGIAATSFMRHDIPTTIVEIDPAVYDAAKTFFGLPAPPPDRLFIQDARGWVHNRTGTPHHTDVGKERGATDTTEDVETIPDDRFDVVVHDCFSGGGIPAHLYTVEFWRELRQIVKPDAVVAVNFAGILTSDSAKAIIMTLRTIFPQCRAFYDGLEPSELATTEYMNWVFFCTPSTNPLEFRTPVTSDFLGSYLRRHILLNLPAREADISAVGEDLSVEERERFILKDAKNPLLDWQKKEAMGHWKLIRSVLPNVFWETY